MRKEHGVRRRRFLTPLACYPLLTTLHPLTTLLYTLHHATLTLPHPDPLTMLPYTLLQAAQTLAERVRLEMEVKAAELEARRQQDVVNRRAKEYAVRPIIRRLEPLRLPWDPLRTSLTRPLRNSLVTPYMAGLAQARQEGRAPAGHRPEPAALPAARHAGLEPRTSRAQAGLQPRTSREP